LMSAFNGGDDDVLLIRSGAPETGCDGDWFAGSVVPQSSEAPIAVGCLPSGAFNLVRVRDGVCTGRASIPGVHHCGCSFDDHFS